jgi:hypothetical protein
VVFSNILGIFYMANGLEHIAKILKELNAELKLDNDKWEKANEPTTTLRPSNDGATSERSIRDVKLCNKGEKNGNT